MQNVSWFNLFPRPSGCQQSMNKRGCPQQLEWGKKQNDRGICFIREVLWCRPLRRTNARAPTTKPEEMHSLHHTLEQRRIFQQSKVMCCMDFGVVSMHFEIRSAARQGCALSPTFFKWIIDWILAQALQAYPGESINTILHASCISLNQTRSNECREVEVPLEAFHHQSRQA